jgi:glycosyltransferase involved in cell wall biosynthesis
MGVLPAQNQRLFLASDHRQQLQLSRNCFTTVGRTCFAIIGIVRLPAVALRSTSDNQGRFQQRTDGLLKNNAASRIERNSHDDAAMRAAGESAAVEEFGPAFKIPLNGAASRQPRTPVLTPPLHINILIASMTLGGAERYVHDMLIGLENRQPTGKLFLMHDLVPSYAVQSSESFPVIRLGKSCRSTRLQAIAMEVTTSPSRLLYTHLIRTCDLRELWKYGVLTVPVIHNSRPGWQDSPQSYTGPQVPFLVATSDSVRDQLISDGCRKPVVVLRHELQRWRSPQNVESDRAEIRNRHGISSDTVLIGMVGQFKSHKAYTRAVRILARLRNSVKCKLMILGGWDHDYGAGRVAHEATIKLAYELGVLNDVLAIGSIQPVDPYYAAFDIFLNTSIYEGQSVATLEAAQSGCSLVVAKVGGQTEALPSERTVIIEDSSDIDSYVAGIHELTKRSSGRAVISPPPAPDLVPRLWCMIARYGIESADAVPSSALTDTLFITSNLNPGGAQRSLTNLLSHLGSQHRFWLCVMNHVLGDHFLASLETARVPVLSLARGPSVLDRVEQLLELVLRARVRTICFWNVEAPVKLLMAKVLAIRDIRLIDVSPGPMLFNELDQAADFQRRIAFTASQYLERLDCFVAKYREGKSPRRYRAFPRRTVVIPNGVPLASASANGGTNLRPASVDSKFAIVTCCRIVPNKRIEWLVEMMRFLARKVPRASLTIVGGVDQRHVGYWQSVSRKVSAAGLRNIYFAGPNGDVFSFLREFKVFVMISNSQGCPNASLEAMACGLPVVANCDGGTRHQVIHGRTGYLVSGENPSEMARRVASLLSFPKRARFFGLAGHRRARQIFSMERMVANYRRILDGQS